MELSTPVIIGIVVLAIILVIVLIAVGVKASKRRKAQQQEEDRRRAAQLREEAAAQEQAVQERDLKVRETELEADRSRLEAERRAKEAEQEQLAAERRRAEVERERAEVDQERSTVQERLAEADRLDPDTAADDSRRGRDRSAVSGDAPRGHRDGREHHEHREHLGDTAHRDTAHREGVNGQAGRGRTGAHNDLDADHGRTPRDADDSAPQRHDGEVHQDHHGAGAAAAGATGAGTGVAGAGISGAADHEDRAAAADTDARGAGHGRRAARPDHEEPLIDDAPDRTPAAASSTETHAVDENRSDPRPGASAGAAAGAGSGSGAHDDRRSGADGGFGHPVAEDRFEQHSDAPRTEHHGQPTRVEHSYEQQTPPAEQQFGHPGTPGAQQTPPADQQFDQHDHQAQGQPGQQFDQPHQDDQPPSQHDQLGGRQGDRQDRMNGPDPRVQDGSMPQEVPAQQERQDQQDPFLQQQQLLNEQNGELPAKTPEHGDPTERPLPDDSAEDGTHHG